MEISYIDNLTKIWKICDELRSERMASRVKFVFAYIALCNALRLSRPVNCILWPIYERNPTASLLLGILAGIYQRVFPLKQNY